MTAKAMKKYVDKSPFIKSEGKLVYRGEDSNHSLDMAFRSWIHLSIWHHFICHKSPIHHVNMYTLYYYNDPDTLSTTLGINFLNNFRPNCKSAYVAGKNQSTEKSHSSVFNPINTYLV